MQFDIARKELEADNLHMIQNDFFSNEFYSRAERSHVLEVKIIVSLFPKISDRRIDRETLQSSAGNLFDYSLQVRVPSADRRCSARVPISQKA